MEIKEQITNGDRVKQPVYKNGHLEWYGCNLEELADRYSTPVHVGSSEAVQDAVQAFKKLFIDAGLPLRIYYSVKTNPVPVFLDDLQKMDCGFEVVSSFETTILKRLGIPLNGIIQTGVYDDNTYSLADIKMITVSSLDQMYQLARISEENKKPISIGITIRPELLRGYWDITLNTSRKSSPMGVSPDSVIFKKMLDLIKQHQYLNLKGFHMHLGSGIRTAGPFLKGIHALENAAIKSAKNGLKIEVLNIGGGYGSPSAPMMKVRNIVRSLLGLKSSQNTIENRDIMFTPIVKQLHQTLAKLKRKGIPINEIAAEPGRILSGPCQLMILTVKEVIRREKQNYLICDGGAMSLSPMLITEHHKILSITKKNGRLINYEVLGRLPTALDRVSASAELPAMEPGDHIALMDTGAYIVSMNNTFSGPRPSIVWIEQGHMEIVRRRETPDDIFSLDLKPESLHQIIPEH